VGEVSQAILDIQPDVVHVTGPHLWNILILQVLRRAGVPTVHTLHDIDPHPGSGYGSLLRVWNRRVVRLADHILVHAALYRDRLLKMGVHAERLTCTPLLHLFLGHTWLGAVDHLAGEVWYEPSVLFFGRLERYKGIDHLLTAWSMVKGQNGESNRLVLAGPGNLNRLWAGPLPPGVEVYDHLIGDEQAIALFRRCGLLVLPYMGATQSALIPAAYFFRKPAIVAPSGALDEYVEDGETGWIVEPRHPPSLARCLAGALSDVPRLARMGDAGRAWYDVNREAEERDLRLMYERVASYASS
jgi:glycosyltransferase involved in cell wall biosynthesis